jgi:ribosomal protein S18 acetylase RimI-like enzyme
MKGWNGLEAGGTHLRIRPVQAGDAAFLLDLYASTREEELNLTGWDVPTRAAFVQMQFRAQHTHYSTHYPNAQHDIVELDGEAIGRIYIDRTEPDIILMDIALLPAFRDRGFGSKILQALLDEASAARRAVTLHVEANNPRAHALYKRFGFVDISSSGMHTLMRRDPA